jgi:hypothetical protein
MSDAANYLENAIAQKLFAGVDFTISNYYGALATVPAGTPVEEQNNTTLYSYELTAGTHPGYTGRFALTWTVTDNVIANSNTETWTVTSDWPSSPTHLLVFNDQNANAGELLFHSPIPGLPGTILTDDVVKLKPNRITITID